LLQRHKPPLRNDIAILSSILEKAISITSAQNSQTTQKETLLFALNSVNPDKMRTKQTKTKKVTTFLPQVWAPLCRAIRYNAPAIFPVPRQRE
jgi:hypothetical protein